MSDISWVEEGNKPGTDFIEEYIKEMEKLEKQLFSRSKEAAKICRFCEEYHPPPYPRRVSTWKCKKCKTIYFNQTCDCTCCE